MSGRKAKAGQTSSEIVKKNRDVLKATVYGGAEFVKKDAESAQMDVDEFDTMIKSGSIVEPPFDLLNLLMMEENNSEMRQIVDAMETNIESFGGRLAMKKMDKETQEKNKEEIRSEYFKLKTWLAGLNPRENITTLRRKARRAKELTGNSYWELIPPKLGDASKISAISYVPSHTVRISKQDKESTSMVRKVYDVEQEKFVEQTFLVRFRRFVQIRNNKKVWFKEYGDPRIVDRETGKAYKNEASAKKAGLPREKFAHSLLHMPIHTDRSPYGIPRYIGNLFSIFGSRASDEINYNTFLNNNVPSLAVLVSGNAMLTEGTINRIDEFAKSVMKRSTNYSKFLVLEAEPATEGGFQNSGTAQIKIERLKNEQQNDQLFQEYDDNNSEKLRRAFRLPPIFVGKSSDYNRATAEASRKLAEEQVFAPEREEVDRQITMLFEDMGFKYWSYKAFSPNVTDDENIVKMMNSIEKTGTMTPNMGRKLLGDMLNQEPEFYDADVPFDPDIPFSLTMAEAVKGASSLGGNPATGALAPNQGQTPKPDQAATKRIDKLISEGEFDKLLDLYDALDQELDVSVGGKTYDS